MEFDLGPQGFGILLALSLGFGLIAQLILRAWGHWVWLVAAIGWFIGGLFASEVLFATATEEDLQPLIDGLFFDEALFGGLIGGVIALIGMWIVRRTTSTHTPMSV